MEIRSKRFKMVLILLMIVFTSVISFLLGSMNTSEKSGESKVINATAVKSNSKDNSSNDDKLRINKIAVVNLDEGTLKNNQAVNYATQMTKFTGDNFESAGFEEAKRGLLTGTYGAYVVIPANFSENIESLNTKIKKSEINYMISNQLAEDSKLVVKEDVLKYIQSINSNISYVYVDSILDEFQNTKSVITDALKNEAAGNDTLSLVQPADLLNFIELPELKQPNLFVDAIDISEEIEKNSGSLTAVLNDYGNLTTSINQDAQNLNSTGSTTVTNINNALSSLSNPFSASGGGTIFDTSIDNTKNNVDSLNKDINSLIAVVESVNYYYNTINSNLTPPMTEYERDISTLETDIDTLFNNYSTNVNVGVVTDPTAGNGLQVTENGAEIIKLLEQTDPVTGTNYYAIDQSELTNLLNTLLSHQKDAVMKPISPSIGSSNTLGTYIMTNYLKRENAVAYSIDTTSGSFNKDGSTIDSNKRLQDGVNAVTSTQSSGYSPRTIMSDLDTLKTSITNAVNSFDSNLTTQMSLVGNEVNAYNTQLSAFDPSNYFSTSNITDTFSNVQSANESIQNKTTQHLNKMNENLTETYSLYGENQVSLVDSVRKSEEKNNEKIESGLSDAKQNLGSLMKENETMLSPITSKLPYLKIGDNTDYNIYQYIVSPLTVMKIDDNSKVKQQAKATKESTTEQSSSAKEASAKNIDWTKIIIVFVLLIVVLLIVVLVQKKLSNNKKW